MIVAGFGCRAGATPAALTAALAATGHDRPDAVAGPADRIALLAPVAARLGVPLIPIDDDALRGVVTPTRSTASLRARGTGSVAEACALIAAGPAAAAPGKTTLRVAKNDTGITTIAEALAKAATRHGRDLQLRR